jgi:hypothetical protein
LSELNQDYNEIISTTADNDDLQNYISTMYGFYIAMVASSGICGQNTPVQAPTALKDDIKSFQFE